MIGLGDLGLRIRDPGWPTKPVDRLILDQGWPLDQGSRLADEATKGGP